MKKIISIICSLLLCVMTYSQSRTVSGCVKDKEGNLLPGVVLLVVEQPGTNAVTDGKGNYSITFNRNTTESMFLFTCLSYKDLRIQVKASDTVVDVVMENDNNVLDEVVVVGYGAMKRSDLTGSVASVKIDENEAMKSASLDRMMEGRAAGVQVLRNSAAPDAGVTVRIRGMSSFSGSSEPLYVVDGVIIGGSSQSLKTMTSGTMAESSNAVESTNGLMGINPQDIASIEILKDASATAIYGSQGANGVVLITTKSANREVPSVNFSAGISIASTDKRLDILSFDEYCDMLEANNNVMSVRRLGSFFEEPSTRTGLKVTPIDWQDYIFRTAISQRYYMSISGKPESFNYLFSLGYNSSEGIIKQSDSDNLTARLNLFKQISKRVKVDFKTNFGFTKSNLVTEAVSGGNITSRSSLLRSTLRSGPFLRDYAIDQEFEITDDDYEDYNFGPSRWLDGTTNSSERFRINPMLACEIKLLNWLSFRSQIGSEISTNERIKSKEAKLTGGDGNMAGIAEGYYFRYNWDNLLYFWKKWGDHSLNGSLGQSLSYSSSEEQSVSGWLLPQANARALDINNAVSDNSRFETYSISHNQLLSFFGRVIYNYREKHILTTTLRFDGSSKFAEGNKWGVFPSFAYAWRIVNEPWFNVSWISNAKLRFGWGQVGNQGIGSYQTTYTYGTSLLGNHFNDSGTVRGSSPSNIRNTNLKWETSNQINAGLDLSLWRGRFTLTADAYRKDTKDLLQNKPVSLSTGYSTVSINDGSIRNSGFEITIDAIPYKYGSFELGIGGNLSFNRNVITGVGASGSSSSLYLSQFDSQPTQCKYFFGDSFYSSPVNIFIEGESMGLFYGYVFDGIVQKGETAPGFTEGAIRTEGYVKYKDLDGNGYIDSNDRTIIGNPLPSFTYGFHFSAAVKGVSLNVEFSGAQGFDIFNLNNVQDYTNTYEKNMRRDAFLKAWTPDNPSNEWPALSCGTDSYISSRYVEDGSYLRISNISLSYSVPIKKKAKILHGLSLTASVGNPVIWTGYSGYSPVNNSFGASVRKMGIDLNSGPYPRSFDFDVKITF